MAMDSNVILNKRVCDEDGSSISAAVEVSNAAENKAKQVRRLAEYFTRLARREHSYEC